MFTQDELKSFHRDVKLTLAKISPMKDNVKKLIAIDEFEKRWEKYESNIKKDSHVYDTYIDLICWEWRQIYKNLSDVQGDTYADSLP